VTSRNGLRTLVILWAGYVVSALFLPGGLESLGVTLHQPMPRTLALAGLIPFLFGLVGCRLRVGGTSPREGWTRAWELARQDGWLGDRPLGYALLVVTLPLFFGAYTAWKTNISPFTWDATFSRLDGTLHGGQPYRWLIGRPGLTYALDRVYGWWNYLFVFLVLWRGWYGSRTERLRFWLAFLVTWIVIGTVLASVFASAGPLFYPRVSGTPGPYGPLLRYLGSLPRLDSHIGSEYLWQAHASGRIFFASGISAFPSMHVGLAVLAVCAAWRHRWAVVGLGVLALGIWLGSVALGWHYAVDGYASLLVVPPLWWATGEATLERQKPGDT
jgi:hypothetical protein